MARQYTVVGDGLYPIGVDQTGTRQTTISGGIGIDEVASSPASIEILSGALTLSSSAPTESHTTNSNVEIPSANTLLSAFALISSTSDHLSIQPDGADLVLSKSSPTLSRHLIIEIPSTNLILSTFIPDNPVRIPASANLVLSTFTISVGYTSPKEIPAANLVLSTSIPTLSQTTSANIQPPSADLIIRGFAPNVLVVLKWPYSTFCPRKINVQLVTTSESGGRSLTGSKQYIQADAGFWKITLGEIRIRSNLDVLEWRELETLLDGRAGRILIPAYDGKRRPIPSDNGPIVAYIDSLVVINAVSANIRVEEGADLEPGMHFSVGDWLYRIRTVGTPSGSPLVYPITFRPPAREAMATDDFVEFDRPVCRCRLESDNGMDINLRLLRYDTPTISFIEDV